MAGRTVEFGGGDVTGVGEEDEVRNADDALGREGAAFRVRVADSALFGFREAGAFRGGDGGVTGDTGSLERGVPLMGELLWTRGGGAQGKENATNESE